MDKFDEIFKNVDNGTTEDASILVPRSPSGSINLSDHCSHEQYRRCMALTEICTLRGLLLVMASYFCVMFPMVRLPWHRKGKVRPRFKCPR